MRTLFACLIAAIVSLLALPSVCAAASLRLRSFDRFEFDPITADSLWAELATTDTHNDIEGFLTTEAVTVEARLVYGGRLAEGGILVPYHYASTGRSTYFGTPRHDENGIGDVRLYGKLLPLHTEWVDAALGMELSIPSGDDDKGLGAGEFGFLPFGSAAVHLGLGDFRTHFGYLAYTGRNRVKTFGPQGNWIAGFERAPDAFVYGGGFFAPVNEHLGLRAEFVGLSSNSTNSDRPLLHHPDVDVLFFEPGFDVRFALDGVDLYIRPSGAIGLTNDSPDWSVGGSIAIAWNP